MLYNIAQFTDISSKKFLSYPGNIKNMSSRKTLKLLRRKQMTDKGVVTICQPEYCKREQFASRLIGIAA